MKVSILGHGVVGKGVWDMLQGNPNFEVVNVLVKKGEKTADFMTESFDDIWHDDSELVVECMGGVVPAYEFASKCIEAGKSFITSNKALVAAHGIDLLNLAVKNNKGFLFSAACGGAIPILQNLHLARKSDSIIWAGGILNGTTNFILSKMITDNMDFAAALRLAQEKGYAEKDPTADVEGIDACRKICILASLASGKHVFPDGIYTEGISALTAEDVRDAAKFGCVIKLIARATRLDDGRWCLTVSPALVPQDHMLAGVSGVFNACLVRGDMVGDVLMYGQGAGKLATASAVVADVIDCAQHADASKVFGWGEADPAMLADPMTVETKLFVRAETADKAADTAKLNAAWPDCTFADSEDGELVFITPMQPEGALRDTLASFGFADMSVIRVF